MKKAKQHNSSDSSVETAALRRVSTTYYTPKSSTKPATTSKTVPEPATKKSYPWMGFIATFILVAILAFSLIMVWNIRNFTGASQKLFGTSNVLGLVPPTNLDATEGRVNIMLVGYSVDNPNHGGAELTDSILIMSLDQATDSGFMLSIPRDMYVDIEDYGMAKINEAYQAGERNEFSDPVYPSGGIGLLRKTITEHFGITIHYDALINYGAVRDTVDALGGIMVNIQSDDERGLYDPNFQPHEGGPLDLANGVQVIDGETALKLSRARGAAGNAIGFANSDFTRTKNQQLVVSAITKELSWTLILDPRTNGQIFDAVGNNVVTDVKLNEVIPLARLLIRTPTSDLQSITLRDIQGENLLSSYQTSSGQSALIPRAGLYDYSEIQSAIRDVSR